MKSGVDPVGVFPSCARRSALTRYPPTRLAWHGHPGSRRFACGSGGYNGRQQVCKRPSCPPAHHRSGGTGSGQSHTVLFGVPCIREQFTERYNEHTAVKAELDALTAGPAPAVNDPTLLDELPYAPGMLAEAPDTIREALYAAFDIQCLYRC